MPRTARIRFPRVPMHVHQRGHNRARSFSDESEFELYLGLLGEFCANTDCKLHAYVLMTNHLHLLLTPEHAHSVTALMSRVNQRFVQHVNRKHERTGSLWEGRFRSSLIDSERYFFTCQRYIELNPVRARMVDDPGRYRWSSYGFNAIGEPSQGVTPHDLYLALGPTDAARQRGYRELFRREIPVAELDAIRAGLKGGRPVGGEAFVREMRRLFGARAILGQSGRRPKGPSAARQQESLFPQNEGPSLV